MGLFVSFEGGEGSGKTTQAALLVERLVAGSHRVEAVHEPGGTKLGAHLREYLKDTDRPLTPEAELYLFVAARSELVRQVIRPALEAGAVVVADRYADSTTAYQGYGRRLPLRSVRSANQLATASVWPDLTVLLDAPVELGLDRARPAPLDQRHTGRAGDGQERRFEEAPVAFHRRVRRGYLRLAAAEPERWAVLDASRPVQALAEEVWRLVAERLGQVRESAAGARARRLPGL